MRCVKGSTTVEMAYVMPLIFLVFLIIVRTTFYYHDKSILDGMAYEAVTTAVQTARNPKAKRMWRRFAGNGSGGNLFIFLCRRCL